MRYQIMRRPTPVGLFVPPESPGERYAPPLVAPVRSRHPRLPTNNLAGGHLGQVGRVSLRRGREDSAANGTTLAAANSSLPVGRR
jgi:hypothetical protein